MVAPDVRRPATLHQLMANACLATLLSPTVLFALLMVAPGVATV